MNDVVLGLAACADLGAERIGGKALGLARLIDRGFDVPPGFVITTDAFRRCVESIDGRIVTIKCGDLGDEAKAAQIRALFARELIRDDLAVHIADAYGKLGDGVAVAVRSSATAEDSGNSSFAGQQDTFLGVLGAESVMEHVVRCWASLYTARAIQYRRRSHSAAEDEAMAVLVQTMVPAMSAGVMMTLHPQSGDRSVVYVESSFGLGESIVRGEVAPDCFTVAKDDLTIRQSLISEKCTEYQRGLRSGVVEQISVDLARRHEASLSASEVVDLARMGLRVDAAFGRPMDIEWAVTRAAGEACQIHVLQARPETVWSRRGEGMATTSADPINSDKAPPGTHWTTANVGEAMPGVQTPLSWTTWKGKLDHGMREAGYAMGVLSGAERSSVLDPLVDIFFGRTAVKVNFFALIGDRIPGASGAELARTYFGNVPADLLSAPTRRRYPIIAMRAPISFIGIGVKLRRFAKAQDTWWSNAISRAATMDLGVARQVLAEAVERHDAAVVMQCVGTLVAVQPIYDGLAALAEWTGTDLAELSAIPGAPEMEMVADIWRASRGGMSIDDIVARHGFHGPNEGELSSRVWREDDTPLRAMVAQYALRSDAENPILLEAARRRARSDLETSVLEQVPRVLRYPVRALLVLARHRIPLRGLAKRSMLQSLDVARAAARSIGEELVRQGVLDDQDDVFFLTVDELVEPDRPVLHDVIRERRAVHAHYQTLMLPSSWSGTPDPIDPVASDAMCSDSVAGVGVSNGMVSGVARVLLSPDFAAVSPGEILVAPHTDPSWSSVMFLCAGLVVDIGGALSHAAVVARELGLPCVVNAVNATRAIRTGDRVSVDGGSGVVRILARADAKGNSPKGKQ